MILYHTLDIAKRAQQYSEQLSLKLIGVQYLCTSFSLRFPLTTTPFPYSDLDGQLECSTPLELIGGDVHSLVELARYRICSRSNKLVLPRFASLLLLFLAFSVFELHRSYQVPLACPSPPLLITITMTSPYSTLSAEVRILPDSRSNSQTFSFPSSSPPIQRLLKVCVDGSSTSHTTSRSYSPT